MTIGRRVWIAGVCLTAISVGFGAGSLAVGSPDEHSHAGSEDHARGGSVAIGARANDPAAGPSWAVRVFTTESGRECVDAGRFDGSSFGRVGTDGRTVLDIPADLQGVCAAPGALPGQGAVMRFAGRRGQPERTVVFGRAAEPVAAAPLLRAGVAADDLPVAADRTFIAVLEGLHDPKDLAVELAGQDGTTSRLDWE
jgi:hypothetical protein